MLTGYLRLCGPPVVVKGQPRTLARLPGGALWRSPYPSEAEWFARHLIVAGFATRQGEVVLNPHLVRRPKQRRSVLLNEATRVYLWRRRCPRIWLNPEQRRRFEGYGRPTDCSDTVIARLIARDPSAGKSNASQRWLSRIVGARLGVTADMPSLRWLLGCTARAPRIISPSAAPAKV